MARVSQAKSFAFFKAILSRDVVELAELIKATPALGKERMGEESQSAVTGLMLAAANGLPKFVSALLPFSDANEKSRAAEETPLMMAAARGDLRIVKLLLPRSDAGLANSSGLSALSLAALNGHGDCVAYLIQNAERPSPSQAKKALKALVAQEQWPMVDQVGALLSATIAANLVKRHSSAALPQCAALAASKQRREIAKEVKKSASEALKSPAPSLKRKQRRL